MDLLVLFRRSAGRLCRVALVCLFSFAAIQAQDAPPPVLDPEVTRQIAEVQKTLSDLQQKVDAISRVQATPVPVRDAVNAVLPEDWVKSIRWRSIGPAGMGGRITALAVFEADPSTWWAATASGGLIKTTNNGVTYEHQFDRETTVSIGDVAVAQSNRDIVWVGTGEANPRNSVSYGDGVYKSLDGGKTWKNMGLRGSFQIGRVVIHPANPEVVYVAALGRLYGPNEERGVFKTTDGGATWTRILYFDDNTGALDIEMNPADPETLIVALWERRRDGYDSHRGTPPVAEGYDGYDPVMKWGPHAGFYKTTDGGRTFKRLTQGLPSSRFGRSDVTYYPKNPNILYAIVDCEKIGMGPQSKGSYMGIQGEDDVEGARLTRVTEKGPADRAGLREDDIILALNGKPVTSYAALSEVLRESDPGTEISFNVLRGDTKIVVSAQVGRRPLAAMGAGPVSAFLGLSGEETPEGLKVTTVTEGGPADRAGLREEDVLKSLEGEPVGTTEQLNELIRLYRPGYRASLLVQRGAETLNLQATLGERPLTGAGGVGAFGRATGGGGGVMTTYFGAFCRDADGGGAQVARVFDDRPAQLAGLEADDVIKSVDGTVLRDAEALTTYLGEKFDGDTVTVSVERGSVKKEIAIKLEGATSGSNRPFGYMYAGQMPNVQTQQGTQGHEYGGVYRSSDGGESWTRINSLNPRPMYFSQIRVDPSDERFLYVLGVSLHRSTNGGKTFTADAGQRVHADHHALWIDSRDGRHMIVGSDGGFYQTWDRTRTWEHLNTLALGQFYHVAVDSRQPYRVYGGLQDNGSWGGPSRTLNNSGILNEDWISVGGGDGFVCRVDPFDPDIIYTESQDGNISRRNLRTNTTTAVTPRAARGQRYRYNWNTPFILSSHNPGIFYSAGNFVFRSLKRGDDLKVISPEITRTGRGSATALGESPRNSDVLWVGTDDGYLWVSRNGGVLWTNVTDRIGLPGHRWVATVEPSRFVEGRCYVAFDAHRSDDDQPYVYVTEDFGDTWKPIRGNLPVGSSRCLREDLSNQNLLYCGTEFAAWITLDRGQNWTKINNNLPTVAVHEFALHPTAGEVAVATHGRSVWIGDVSSLRQMTATALASPAFLYNPQPVIRFRSEPSKGTGTGFQRFVGENPARGARITYSLTSRAQSVTLRLFDAANREIRTLNGETEPGLHTVVWDMTSRPTAQSGVAGPGGTGGRGRGARGETESAETAPSTQPATQPASAPTGRRTRPQAGAGGGPGAGGAGGRGRAVELGVYRVVLDVDGRQYTSTIRIEADPNLSPEDLTTLEEAVLSAPVDGPEK